MRKSLNAFTLAEVLVTLVLIGVVAALTIPHAQMYVRETQYVNRLKKFYSIANQAFRHRMAQDGVTDIAQSSIIASINGDSTAGGDQDNFTTEMMKLFRVNSFFNGGSYPGNTSYKTVQKDEDNEIWTNNDYTLVLVDGTVMHMDINSYGIDGADPHDIKFSGGKLYKVYGTIEVDINGDNEPNRWGRDYYRFVLGQDGFIYPFGGKDYQIFETGSLPSVTDGEYSECLYQTGYTCAARIIEKDWSMDY